MCNDTVRSLPSNQTGTTDGNNGSSRGYEKRLRNGDLFGAPIANNVLYSHSIFVFLPFSSFLLFSVLCTNREKATPLHHKKGVFVSRYTSGRYTKSERDCFSRVPLRIVPEC